MAWYPLSYFNPSKFHVNILFYNFISLLHDQMIEFDHNFIFESSFRFKEYIIFDLIQIWWNLNLNFIFTFYG